MRGYQDHPLGQGDQIKHPSSGKITPLTLPPQELFWVGISCVCGACSLKCGAKQHLYFNA